MTGPRAALALIAGRRFGPFFAGSAIWATGVWFGNLATGLLLFRLTRSELLLGLLAASQFLPTLLLVGVVGRAADRFDRRRVIVTGQIASTALAGAVAALAAVDAAGAAAVLVLSLALGVAQAFVLPAAQAHAACLVAAREIPSAMALTSMTHNLARAIGPALAALVVTVWSIPAALAISAAAYLALAVGVSFDRAGAEPPTRGGPPARVRDTLTVVLRRRDLAGSLVVVMVVGFASDPVNTMAPAFAVAFDRPDTDAGLVIGAFGAGAVLAAIVLVGRLGTSQAAIGAALLALGGGIVVFALMPGFAPALVSVAAAGFAYLASNAAATARLQLGVGDAERGRIMALWAVAFLGLRPIASLADGLLAEVAGVRAAGVALALPAVVLAAALLWRSRVGWASRWMRRPHARRPVTEARLRLDGTRR